MCGLAGISSAEGPLNGFTFASEPGVLYVSVRDFAKQTGKALDYDAQKNVVLLAGQPLSHVRQLRGSGSIIRVSDLKQVGATVNWDLPTQTATLQLGAAKVEVKQGAKKVVVDQGTQTLVAYQGDAVVLKTHVSTGREGHHTPNGNFTAGPTKERIHYSHLYEEAPMPYSVQVDGNVFIHGYTSVPHRPASHGCVRMPLSHGNPAKYFYEWVDVGTPVTIQGHWTEPVSFRHRPRRRRTYVRRVRKSGVSVAVSAPAPDASSQSGPQAVPIAPTNP